MIFVTRLAAVTLMICWGITLIACSGTGNKSDVDQAQPKGHANVRPLKVHLNVPPKQSELLSVCDSFDKLLKKAPNDLKRQELVEQQEQAMNRVLANTDISEWVGTLVRMNIIGGLYAYIDVGLADPNFQSVSFDGARIGVRTWEDVNTDVGKTMILKGSPLYRSISELSIGDTVKISGVFIREGGNPSRMKFGDPGWRLSGTRFIVRFSQVTKHN